MDMCVCRIAPQTLTAYARIDTPACALTGLPDTSDACNWNVCDPVDSPLILRNDDHWTALDVELPCDRDVADVATELPSTTIAKLIRAVAGLLELVNSAENHTSTFWPDVTASVNVDAIFASDPVSDVVLPFVV